MAFTPDEGSGSTGHSGLAAAKSLFGDSGSMSDANLAKSLAGAEAFKAAAKAGRIALDPEQAKGAIKELERAEDIAWNMRRHAQAVAQPLRMGSSPYGGSWRRSTTKAGSRRSRRWKHCATSSG